MYRQGFLTGAIKETPTYICINKKFNCRINW